MDLNLIKKLIRVVEKSEITEFSFSEGDMKVKISKNSAGVPQFVSTAVPQSTPQTVPAASESKPAETKSSESTASQNLHEVKSPIVGTFYRAPAPDADPYCQVGDTISAGNVLCIVEAMKLMNEIEAECDGVIKKIAVENEEPVEYNQILFEIEP